MKPTAMIMAIASMSVFASQSAMAVPVVSSVDMNQSSKRVDITYTLSGEAAVITLDVQTNANTSASADDPGWTSIGGEAVCNASGDVWKRVEAGSRAITWRPDLSWPDHVIADGGARAVVTAWELGNTPKYMVVDLAAANSVRYYPDVDFLPGSELGQKGAVTNNTEYKTSKLLMRKIMADGVEWTMGSADGEKQRTAAKETPHVVELTNNYYIGVFEVTQEQWKNIATNSTQSAYFTVDGKMLPMENVCYNEIRLKANSNAAATSSEIANYSWPKAPHPSSFLGLLRSKTGLDFDLPSEAQWEFAARSGNGSGFWNDGSDILDADRDDNLGNLGRYVQNSPTPNTNPANTLSPSEGGTAIVGSYASSDWGLYDMHGNVWEWCLDWHVDNITDHGGKVNINPSSPENPLSGSSDNKRERRGGGIKDNSASTCRPAFRHGNTGHSRMNDVGFRVVCTAGLR